VSRWKRRVWVKASKKSSSKLHEERGNLEVSILVLGGSILPRLLLEEAVLERGSEMVEESCRLVKEVNAGEKDRQRAKWVERALPSLQRLREERR